MPNTGDGEEIPSVRPEILRAASRGTLVLFIGAGISRFADCPSWREYAERKLDFLFRKHVIAHEEKKFLTELSPKEILSICDIAMKGASASCDVKEFFRPPNDDALGVFKDICDMQAIYVTTNYDQNIERASDSRPRRERKSVRLQSVGDDAIAHLVSGNIIHLHGCETDPDSMIETVNDYGKAYFIQKSVGELLDKMFRDFTVLFLGYGLEEMEILHFLLKNQSGPGKNCHFMLWGRALRSEYLYELMKKYYGALGITVIGYPLWKHGYEHLKTVIRAWSAEIAPVARPTDHLTRAKIILDITGAES